MTHLALPLTCGLSPREVADRVNETTGWVTKRLRALRKEIALLSS